MGIKFPTPWKTLAIKFPPPRDGKSVKCPGYARGGMLKLPFDRYISSARHVGSAFETGLSVPFTGKRPRRPETGIKDRFEEMEHEFQHGILRPEKEEAFHMLRYCRKFSAGTTKKSCSIHFPTGFSGNCF